jgi:hypothetical protein
LLVLASALAVALVLGALALFAAEARASAASPGRYPPLAVLMKYKIVLQMTSAAGGRWCFYEPPANGEPGGFPCAIYDNFGVFDFPKPDEVGAGRRLHVRFKKPVRPNFAEVDAWPRAKKPKGYEEDERPVGQMQRLKSILRPVKQDGKTVGWDVFFRVNEPGRHYYLRVASGWERVPGKHASYGRIAYGLHVKTR